MTAIQGGGNASARSGSREARPGAEPWPSLAWQAPRRSAERRAPSVFPPMQEAIRRGRPCLASTASTMRAFRRSASLFGEGFVGMAWQNSGAWASREWNFIAARQDGGEARRTRRIRACPLPLRERASPEVQQARLGEGLRPRPLTRVWLLERGAALSRKGRGHAPPRFAGRDKLNQTAPPPASSRPRPL